MFKDFLLLCDYLKKKGGGERKEKKREKFLKYMRWEPGLMAKRNNTLKDGIQVA